MITITQFHCTQPVEAPFYRLELLFLPPTMSTVADPPQARNRHSPNDPREPSVPLTTVPPTRYPRINRPILRLASKLLTWLGPSHRWLSSPHDVSLRTVVLLAVGCFLILIGFAASGYLLWTPLVLGVTATLLGFISVWSLTYCCLPFGLATYLSVFGVLTIATVAPSYGGRLGGMAVHLYVILCSIWIAFFPIVVTVGFVTFLCGRALVERNIRGRVWPQQLGTFEFELGMIPPPDSDVENRRGTLSESYASPTHNRDRAIHQTR